ncbi:single-stranded DNA-binding protein [Microbacterium sp. NPDC077663]|uniref:single-stranded DNA-binding protein n=1 Tax=Microbacterium sp. NPDC077663 TaxID=3364189 RepID=UPI0037C658EC
MKDHITIVGNVGADPEFRRLPDGTPVVSLRVASTDRRYDAKAGAWADGLTSWYRVSVFRALGEHVAASVRRGQRVVVHGTLAIKRWEAGEKSGTDAEIDALAVGHDLAFGTTVFTGASRPRDEAHAPATEWAPADDSADATEEDHRQPEAAGTPF